MAYRVLNIRLTVHGESRPKRGEVFDILCVALRHESAGFAQREGPVELLRGKSQDVIAVRPRHGQDKIGIGGNLRRELSCGEIGDITTQLREDARSDGLNRMPCQGVGTGTRCCEILNIGSGAVCDSESFRSRGTTDVSSADKQYVQSKLLL